MIELYKDVVRAQLEAALWMLNECIELCPGEAWEGAIAKYPFWQVAYHTLCFVDYYLAPSADAWRPSTGPGGFHPKGMAELGEEYPSRRFEKAELLAYAAICRTKIGESIGAETAESLAGPSGFPRLRFPRAELHIYNTRHIQHHAGQLGAYLRRFGLDPSWKGSMPRT